MCCVSCVAQSSAHMGAENAGISQLYCVCLCVCLVCVWWHVCGSIVQCCGCLSVGGMCASMCYVCAVYICVYACKYVCVLICVTVCSKWSYVYMWYAQYVYGWLC